MRDLRDHRVSEAHGRSGVRCWWMDIAYALFFRLRLSPPWLWAISERIHKALCFSLFGLYIYRARRGWEHLPTSFVHLWVYNFFCHIILWSRKLYWPWAWSIKLKEKTNSRRFIIIWYLRTNSKPNRLLKFFFFFLMRREGEFHPFDLLMKDIYSG